MRVHISSSRRVHCEAAVRVPLSATAAWGQLRDFKTSACHDPFHYDVSVNGGVPRAGAGIELGHRYLGFRSRRVGRILVWTEGAGFAFSDLCRSDRRRGFPHVLSYRLTPTAEKSCVLTIRVGGRWTSRVPIVLGRCWLSWVFGHVVRTAENRLLVYAAVMRRHRRGPATN